MSSGCLATTTLIGLVVAGVTLAQQTESPEALVLRCIGHLHRGEIDAAATLFAPDALGADGAAFLAQAHDSLSLGATLSAQIAGTGFEIDPSGQRIDSVIYHVRGTKEAVLILAQTGMTAIGPRILGILWEPTPLELGDRHPFVWSGVSYVHYYVLFAAVAVFFFILYTVVQCVRREPWRRWLWLVLIVHGFGKVTATWLPGPPLADYFQFSPLSVQLFGAGMLKSPIYEPWTISVSLPLGAAFYLWWCRRRAKRASPALAERDAAIVTR